MQATKPQTKSSSTSTNSKESIMIPSSIKNSTKTLLLVPTLRNKPLRMKRHPSGNQDDNDSAFLYFSVISSKQLGNKRCLCPIGTSNNDESDSTTDGGSDEGPRSTKRTRFSTEVHPMHGSFMFQSLILDR